MHAALMLHSLGHGGTERQVVYMTAGLVERGHRVTVVEIRRGAHFRDDVLNAGGEVVSADAHTRAGALTVLRALRPIGADVVYGLNPEANVLALGAGAPVVFGVRNTNLDRLPKDGLARMAVQLQHRLARRARLVVANSHAAGSELRRAGYPPARVRVVSNGLDADRFARDRRSRARWRERLGVRDGTQLIGTVARMDRQKDAPTFLRAAARCARADRRFVWFGDGPLREEVEALAGALGVEVLLPGAARDVAGCYAALDVFTLSSAWGEAFSNAFAEALAAGLPCVVTDVGDHGRAAGVARVVEPGDPAALAAAWDAASPGAGPRWVRQHMDIDQMVSSTEALLLEALRGQ